MSTSSNNNDFSDPERNFFVQGNEKSVWISRYIEGASNLQVQVERTSDGVWLTQETSDALDDDYGDDVPDSPVVCYALEDIEDIRAYARALNKAADLLEG